jgi:Zn-dependent peptidase ImmA (M78 family)
MKHRPESKCTRGEIFQFNMEADFCASALLMPDVKVVKVLEEGKTPEVLAHLFDVSEDAMKRKLDYLQKSRLL